MTEKLLHIEHKNKRIPLTLAQTQRVVSIQAALQQIVAAHGERVKMLEQTRDIMLQTILEYNETPPGAAYDLTPDCTALILKEEAPK